MYKVTETENIRPLFDNMQETIVWSCLDKCMGAIYADSLERPKSAMALLGDFCFFAGEPDYDLVDSRNKVWNQEFLIMVPENELWAALIEKCYGGHAIRITRYAIQKEEHIWDLDKLKQICHKISKEFELKFIDEEIYNYAKQSDWAADLVSQFPDYASYRENGLGVAALKDGILVSGASSYSFYKGGIEIEIDTRKDYRRRGLAAACGAALILECEKRGIYPSWDAQNKGSVALAEKLGYHFDREYCAYEIQ